jgi:fimbrial chaperone protein
MISRQLKKFLAAVATAATVTCSLFAASAAFAQQVIVSPLRVTFKNDQQSELVTIRNTSKQAFTIQPRVMKWSQKDGRDLFDATRDILVAPPIVEIPPGEAQVIRLALKRPPEAGNELTYRLFIQQVVAPQASTTAALSFSWSLSLPLFVVAPDSPGSTTLQWTGAVSGKTLSLNAMNTGKMHIQVKKIRVETSAGVSASDQMFYLLPSQQMNMALPIPGGLGKSITLVAETDAGELKQEVPLQ